MEEQMYTARLNKLNSQGTIHNKCAWTKIFWIMVISSILPGFYYFFTSYHKKTPTTNDFLPPPISQDQEPIIDIVEPKASPKNESKKIRVHFVNYEHVDHIENAFVGCKYDQCSMTSAGKDIDNSDKDVLMFYAPHIAKIKRPPPKRRGQIWVLFSQESPVHHQNDFKQWENKFNWTITYRYDSDGKASYGEFRPRTANDFPELDVTSAYRNKTVDAAWWVSNCHTSSKRSEFTQKLKKYLDVHIYGACQGTHQCKHNTPRCYELLNNTYKFYLSLENSLCHDYITDKVFKFYDHEIQVIVVVRGGIDDVYKKLLPPNSYINTANFKTIKDLADYMKMVGNNETLYKSYFNWQKKYRVGSKDYEQKGFCKVCEMAHKQKQHKRLYHKISDWFGGSTDYKKFCKGPTDL